MLCTLFLTCEDGLQLSDKDAVLEELQGLLFGHATMVDFDGHTLSVNVPFKNLVFLFEIWFERYKGTWFDTMRVVPSTYLYWEKEKGFLQQIFKTKVHYK